MKIIAAWSAESCAASIDSGMSQTAGIQSILTVKCRKCISYGCLEEVKLSETHAMVSVILASVLLRSCLQQNDLKGEILIVSIVIVLSLLVVYIVTIYTTCFQFVAF